MLSTTVAATVNAAASPTGNSTSTTLLARRSTRLRKTTIRMAAIKVAWRMASTTISPALTRWTELPVASGTMADMASTKRRSAAWSLRSPVGNTSMRSRPPAS